MPSLQRSTGRGRRIPAAQTLGDAPADRQLDQTYDTVIGLQCDPLEPGNPSLDPFVASFPHRGVRARDMQLPCDLSVAFSRLRAALERVLPLRLLTSVFRADGVVA
jgi:hypothetical protein